MKPTTHIRSRPLASGNGIPASQAATDTIPSAFDTARLVVLIAILVRRSMEPTGRGAVNNIWQPIPTVGPRYCYTK
jgi:hypothetical protein